MQSKRDLKMTKLSATLNLAWEDSTNNYIQDLVKEFVNMTFGISGKTNIKKKNHELLVDLLNAKRILEGKLLQFNIAQLRAVSLGMDPIDISSAVATLEDINKNLNRVRLTKNFGKNEYDIDTSVLEEVLAEEGLAEKSNREVLSGRIGEALELLERNTNHVDVWVKEQEAINAHYRIQLAMLGTILAGGIGVIAYYQKDAWLPFMANALSAQTFATAGDNIKTFFLDSVGPKLNDAAQTIGNFCQSNGDIILISMTAVVAAVTIGMIIKYAISGVDMKVDSPAVEQVDGSSTKFKDFAMNAFGVNSAKLKANTGDKLSYVMELFENLNKLKSLQFRSHIAQLRAGHSDQERPVLSADLRAGSNSYRSPSSAAAAAESTTFDRVMSELSNMRIIQGTGFNGYELDLSSICVNDELKAEFKEKVASFEASVTEYEARVNKEVENSYYKQKLAVGSVAMVASAGLLMNNLLANDSAMKAREIFSSFGTEQSASAFFHNFSSELLIAVAVAAVIAMGVAVYKCKNSSPNIKVGNEASSALGDSTVQQAPAI